MGRTKGSKNKKTLSSDALEIKKDNTLLGNEKDIKKEIKRLKKVKLACRAGTTERISLEHKIKALKGQLAEVKAPDLDKDPIIAEILGLEKKLKIVPTFEDLGIDLHIHSVKDLKIHLEKLKAKVRA